MGLKGMGQRVSKCLKHKWIMVKEYLGPYARLNVATTWLELPFCPLIYVHVEGALPAFAFYTDPFVFVWKIEVLT